MTRAAFVINPRAANGRCLRRWRRFKKRLARDPPWRYAEHRTAGPRDAESVARRTLEEGADLIVAVGGDGTLNEVANGFFDGPKPINPHAALALLPWGTGQDFARSLELPTEPGAALALLREGEARPTDLGRATYRSMADTLETRWFANIAEFGSGGAVVDRVNRTTKVFGGRLSFSIAILRTLPKYRNRMVTFRADTREAGTMRVNNVVVANGRFFGGGLMPAPEARLDDGLFDVVIFGDIDFSVARRHLGDLRRGTHLSLPFVRSFRAATLDTADTEGALVDLDGELVGHDPNRFEIVPKAVLFVAKK